MLLDLGLTSDMQLNQILGLSKHAQKLGFKNVWLGEDISGRHDVFTVASIILLNQPGMNVGIGITSPLIRNITTIARATVGLAETAGNEHFRLGLGIGGLQDLSRLGITVRNPRNVMRGAVALLKRIWNGENVSFEGEGFVLRNYRARHLLLNHVPIFLGARGPKMLKLAGEIADGIILSGPKTYLGKAIKLVKGSIENSPHPERNFSFVVWIPTILTKKPSELDLVQKVAASVLVDTPRKVLEMAELDYGQIETILRVYRRNGLAKVAKLVGRDLIEEVAIHGNSKKVCQAFKLFEKMGVNEVVFGPPYGVNSQATLTELARAWRRFC